MIELAEELANLCSSADVIFESIIADSNGSCPQYILPVRKSLLAKLSQVISLLCQLFLMFSLSLLQENKMYAQLAAHLESHQLQPMLFEFDEHEHLHLCHELIHQCLKDG